MSREIKFRAWDVTDQVMIPADRLKFDSIEPLVDQFKCHAWMKFMQFTGLRDSEGREIYEGDILKMNGGADDIYGVVGFEFGCYVFEAPWIKKGKYYPELKMYTDVPDEIVNVFVAGNIHEHPHLLNNEQEEK